MKEVGSLSNCLTYARSNGGKFQISSIALAGLCQYIQDDPRKTEAGGVLLGRHILESSNIIVDQVTMPLPGDRRNRFRFFRARQHHQEQIDQAWQSSGGTCTYLGEWHTHPQAVPVPSVIDRVNWQRKLRFDRYSEPLFFVIVGTAEIKVWEGYRDQFPRPLLQLE